MLNIEIRTKRLTIKRFSVEDIEKIFNLFQNHEVLYYYLPDNLPEKFQISSLNSLYDYLSDWDDDESSFLFSCYENTEIVAIFSLDDFSIEQRHTECGIALVDKKYYRQGYASEIVETMLEFLFERIKLHRVYIRYIEGNTASYKLFAKFGFKAEGRLREHIKRDQGYLDMYYMGLLRPEFKRNV